MLDIGFTPQNYFDSMKIFNDWMKDNFVINPIYTQFLHST